MDLIGKLASISPFGLPFGTYYFCRRCKIFCIMTRNYWYYFYLLFLELLQMRDTELMMSRLLVLKMIDILTASLRKRPC